MADNAGVWINYDRAVLVFFDETGPRIENLARAVEKTRHKVSGSRPRSASGTQPPGSAYRPEEDQIEPITTFFDKVIKAVGAAESIAVLGPGLAKTAFRKRLEYHKLGDRIVSVAPADRMSDRRIAARFRDFFEPPTERRRPPQTAKEQKALRHSKNPGPRPSVRLAQAETATPAGSRKRLTGPAMQAVTSEAPKQRREVKRGTGQKNLYANMPHARKVR